MENDTFSYIDKLMRMSNKDVILNYLEKIASVTPTGATFSYLGAVIFNKKVTRLLLGLDVSTENNFDVITYNPKTNINRTRSLFNLFENYIRMDIYKTTGVSYTEFKNMTIIERDLFIEYLGFKIDSSNIDFNNSTAALNEANDNNDNLFNV